MKNKRGFTLVELLAVIVILGIILLIAVPKIMSTISDATDASFESSAKMIAASAEREYTVQQTLGETPSVACSDVATLSSTDYNVATCLITFTDGVATVDICGNDGSGKFANKCVCDATRLTATVTDSITACPA